MRDPVSADLQSVPGHFVHVELTDGVLQAGLGAALWDGLGDRIHIEVRDLQVVFGLSAGRLPWLLLRLTAGMKTGGISILQRHLVFKHQLTPSHAPPPQNVRGWSLCCPTLWNCLSLSDATCSNLCRHDIFVFTPLFPLFTSVLECLENDCVDDDCAANQRAEICVCVCARRTCVRSVGTLQVKPGRLSLC